MKYLLAFVLILLSHPAFAGDSSAYAQIIARGSIRCGYFTWPPYILKDPNTGKLSGINYDVVEELGKQLGLKIEWSAEVGVGEVIEGLNTGKYDMMCASLWPDAARLKGALLTRPEFYSSVYAVVRKEDARFDGDISKVNDAKIRILGVDGDITYSLPKLRYKNAALSALPQMSDASALMQSVATNKADVIFIDRGAFNDFNKTNPGKLKLVEKVEPITTFAEMLVVKNGETELKTLIDIALGVLIDNGTIAEIVRKYPDNHYFAPKAGW